MDRGRGIAYHPPDMSDAPAKKEQEAPQDERVRVSDLRPEGDENTCLRPLGLCELGGCCDVCFYRPDHPRFKKTSQDKKRSRDS